MDRVRRDQTFFPFSNNLDFLQIKQKDQMPRTFNQKIELENELEEIRSENSFFSLDVFTKLKIWLKYAFGSRFHIHFTNVNK